MTGNWVATRCCDWKIQYRASCSASPGFERSHAVVGERPSEIRDELAWQTLAVGVE